MDHKTVHPDYRVMRTEWQMAADALLGETQIKLRADVYLPKTAGMINAEQSASLEIGAMYQAYKSRAQYPGWVRDSVRSMIGLISRLKTSAQLDHPKIKGMEYSATADGYPINQLFLRTVQANVRKGRFGLLCDIDDKGLPFIATYEAESIINWRTSAGADGRLDLSLLVLKEAVLKSDNLYSHDTKNEYLVYWLENGQCYSKRIDEGGVQVGEISSLTTSSGAPLGFIPFVFSGAVDNSPDVDIIPLSTMIKSAIKSYQLSADYYQELHLTAHPQPVITGQDLDLVNMVTGPMVSWVLPNPDARAFYLEISGVGIEAKRQAMADQKNAALEAGARVMDVGGAESGQARLARQNDQYATLQGIVKNSAEAVEQCLRYLGEWYSLSVEQANEQLKFTVDLDFGKVIDPAMLQQLFNAAQMGMVSPETVWEYMQTGQLPERGGDDEHGRILGAGANNDG